MKGLSEPHLWVDLSASALCVSSAKCLELARDVSPLFNAGRYATVPPPLFLFRPAGGPTAAAALHSFLRRRWILSSRVTFLSRETRPSLLLSQRSASPAGWRCSPGTRLIDNPDLHLDRCSDSTMAVPVPIRLRSGGLRTLRGPLWGTAILAARDHSVSPRNGFCRHGSVLRATQLTER